MLYNLRRYIFNIIRGRMIGFHKRYVQYILSGLIPSSISIISIHYREHQSDILSKPNNNTIILLLFDDNGIICNVPILY
jgi:hypothetical protein